LPFIDNFFTGKRKSAGLRLSVHHATMQLKIIIALLIFFYPFLLKAQPGFNLVPPQEYPKAHFRNMILDDDTIVGYGMAFSDTIEWEQGLYIAKFDSSGNPLASILILDSLGDALSMDQHYGKMSKVSDGGYAFTAAPLQRQGAMLVKVNSDLQVEFIHEYPDTVNLSHFNYQAPIEIQSGYLLYGDIQRLNYLDDPFVRRVDKEGNTVWFNYYGSYDVEDGFNDLKLAGDSIFVACGVIQLGPQAGRSKIVYLNLEGSVLRQWQSEENPEIGFLRNIIPTSDGGLITYGIYLKEIIFSTLIMQPTLAKLDSNFQVQWVRHFGKAASLNARINLRDFKPTADGNYIAAGETTIPAENNLNRRVGWLYKFSPQGDSIWSKHIDTPLGAAYPIGGYFGGVGELSSGSIVAGGAAYEGSTLYPWLVKVGANGCLEEPCPVLSAIAGPAAPAEEIRLFPNPNNGRFRLSWEQAPAGSSALCTLFDAQGRAAWREERQAAPEMEVNASGLVPGFYVLEVRAGGRRWVGKVVVARE